MCVKVIFEDLLGQSVCGYCVLSFFISIGNLWVFDCLVEVGYCYSFSIYLIKYDYYGIFDVLCFMYDVCLSLSEIFVIIICVFLCNWLVSGGGYFCLMFYVLLCCLLCCVNEEDKIVVVFYFYFWEVDLQQLCVVGVSVKVCFCYYFNLDCMEGCFDCLFGDFCWGCMDNVFFKDVLIVN